MRAFLIGVRSILDLRGASSYRDMQRLMPDPRLKPMADIYRETNALLSTHPRPDGLMTDM